ncbi:hypothetical protein BJ878DRAFT_543786 [Calycina marina]|uniref:Uncharacterized protein n=1 Tax=Calycina marina TaxID=1763456 RepID=A0A9P7Z082_9HELO|nr:hypothetical protein BJ878DRAFT_543786 [Calycina marina]
MLCVVPKFMPTTNPELDALLLILRNRAFVPPHLHKKSQKLIYSPKYREKLLSETVYANIGDEKVRLEPIDVTKDVPCVRKVVQQAYQMMKDKKDWANLPAIFIGAAGIKFPVNTVLKQRIVAAAVLNGRSDIILECIRQKTFTKEEYSTIASRLIFELQNQALACDWEEEYTEKALVTAESALAFLDEKHYHVKTKSTDLRGRPEIVGQVLELAAVRASKHLGGKDVDRKVETYAKALLSTLENGIGKHRRDEHFLKNLVPVFYGMKLAQTVLKPGSPIVSQLEAKAAGLETELHERAAKLQAESPDCVRSTDEIMTVTDL